MENDDENSDSNDFSNERVNQIIAQYEKKIISHTFPQRDSKIDAKVSYLRHANERKWLKQKGKNYLIDFDQNQRQEMKKFFNTLDKKKTGSIGLDELQQMLLSVGLADNREEVKDLMGSVDEDHSGKIQFEEFLQMIKDDTKQNEEIVNFFKQLVSKHVEKIKKVNKSLATHFKPLQNKLRENKVLEEGLKDLPFEMILNQIRRTFMLSSLNIGRCKVKHEKENLTIQKGKQVVQALQKMEERRIIRALHEENQLKLSK